MPTVFITNRCTEWTGLSPTMGHRLFSSSEGLHKYRRWDLRIGDARVLAMNREHVSWSATTPGDSVSKGCGVALKREALYSTCSTNHIPPTVVLH